ncbi:MAG: hypothetical protein IPM25_03340 [Chloracidobacterium sp.]|nr:hypothetical protein [Chloracidobacterium sp.]
MKNLLKRILLIILAVLIAVQAPFIYRRYKIGQLAKKIEELNQSRTPPAPDQRFKEYKGIIHAHTHLGGHSTGSFEEMIAAANANDLDFVILTEHWSDTIDTSAMTLNGIYGQTLFIGGSEIDTADAGDRFLMIPGSGDAASLRKVPTAAVIDKLHAENRLAFVTYPEKLNSWNAQFDGIEVFSLHTNAKKMNPFTAIFDAIWSFPAYPELMLATYFKRPEENLRKFDEIAAKREISLFAGTDAHSNIGVHLFGDDAGNKGLKIKIDPYATIFRLARQHVLIERDKPLTKESLVEALKAGRSYIGLDVIGDTSGFSFECVCGDDLVRLGSGPSATGSQKGLLRGTSPSRSRFVLLKDGQTVLERSDALEFTLPVTETGAYRLEVYLDQLGPPFDKMPWIISNPIYVR